MRFDVDRLLQFDYLNSLVLQNTSDIIRLRDSFLEQYSLDKLKEMELSNIISLFDHYNVEKTDIIRYLESDFIDESWEFADLFQDDIGYSKELSEQVKNGAISEINELNIKIDKLNEENQRKIDALDNDIMFVNTIIKLLEGKGIYLNEDIDFIHLYILNSQLSDEDKFAFSYNIVCQLLEEARKVSLEKASIDTSSFEKSLDEVYSSAKYEEEIDDLKVEEPVYSETLQGYYKEYKHLFDEEGLGSNLFEVMNTSITLASGINSLPNSMFKDNFCVELGALLYKLNEASDRSVVDSLLRDLSMLDKLYDADCALYDYKENLLKDINDQLELLSGMEFSSEHINKTRSRLLLLRAMLNKIINSNQKQEIDLEFKNIKVELEGLSKTAQQLKRLSHLYNDIVDKIKKSYLVVGIASSEYVVDLDNLRVQVLNFMDTIKENKYDSKNDDEILVYEQKFVDYTSFAQETKEDKDLEKVTLKGFVLFDFGENNVPYVVSDLDPGSNKNLIDESILQNKLNGGYEDYNLLIKDLLVYGVPKVLRYNNPNYNLDRILTNVFYDNHRTYPTKMVRIRPRRNSLVRFVSQKISLKSGTEKHKQVVDIIREVLPNANILDDEDFSLYINFSSVIKELDKKAYPESINRYERMSPLYKLFIENIDKEKLTDEECNLLRDIINMTLNAYNELHEKNPNLKFDIIDQMGGNKSRGK